MRARQRSATSDVSCNAASQAIARRALETPLAGAPNVWSDAPLEELMREAAQLRDEHYTSITFSPKVRLPGNLVQGIDGPLRSGPGVHLNAGSALCVARRCSSP